MTGHEILTPLGAVLAIEDAGALWGLYFKDSEECPALTPLTARSTPLIDRLTSLLDAYFDGRTPRFDLPLVSRGSDFQRRVWSRLKDQPYGSPLSYGELAQAIGAPGAARAVGGAVGRNPWVIVVPCHRVLAGGGRLGGFSSGLQRKERLLELERISWRV